MTKPPGAIRAASCVFGVKADICSVNLVRPLTRVYLQYMAVFFLPKLVFHHLQFRATQGAATDDDEPGDLFWFEMELRTVVVNAGFYLREPFFNAFPFQFYEVEVCVFAAPEQVVTTLQG